jgi:galactose-1-phosphate uridylyltransferase
VSNVIDLQARREVWKLIYEIKNYKSDLTIHVSSHGQMKITTDHSDHLLTFVESMNLVRGIVGALVTGGFLSQNVIENL